LCSGNYQTDAGIGQPLEDSEYLLRWLQYYAYGSRPALVRVLDRNLGEPSQMFRAVQFGHSGGSARAAD